MKHSLRIGLVAGLAGLAVALWLGGGWLLRSGPGPEPAAGRVDDAVAREDALRTAAAQAAVDPDRRSNARAPSGDEAPSRTALGTRVELRVVELESGRALPGARLRATTPPDPAADWQAQVWDLDAIDAWMEAHGEPLAVDGEGRAFVPLPASGLAVVVGAAPGLWGRTIVRAAAEGPQRLELAPDAGVEVRTVDPSGAPRPGIPVTLLATRDGWSQERARRVTDADGRARLSHVGQRIRETAGTTRWSIAAALLLAEQVAERLDPLGLPAAPVVLVVPASGAVEVRVLPLPGGPALRDGEVSLVALVEGAAARPGFWSQPMRFSAPLRDGLARFEPVGLDLELAVEARGAGSTQPTRLRARGPTSSGEVKRLELVLGSDHPVLRLRLIDAAGRPLAGTDVRTELEQSTVFSSATSTDDQRTDDHGVLHHDLPPDGVEGGERWLTLTTAAAGGRPPGRARLDLARRFPPGLSDLGDVQVAAGELLAAGRVVDADGAPLAGARVSVAVSQAAEGDPTWYARRSELGTTSGAAGGFEVRGPSGPARLRLEAAVEGLAGEPVDVPVGATGVVLRLGRAGSVEGRVLVDEGVPLEELRVQLHLARGIQDARGERSEVTAVRADGTFVLGGVAPGPYDLVVRAQRAGDELASLEGLLVPEGAACPDVRLEAIDLRGRVCSFLLELVPPRAGMPVSGVVVVRPTGTEPSGESERTRIFLGEQVPFTVVAPALDLEILAQGFRRVRLEAVRSDVRVELEEGPRVRLRLPAEVELPTPPRYLKAFVGTEGDFWALGHMQDAVFGPDRELVLRAAQPGTLQVLWMLEERSEDTTSTTSLGYEQPQTIEVLDLAGEQVFDVAPDPASYAEALERWRER